MKQLKLIRVIVVTTVIGLLLTGCGAGNKAVPSEQSQQNTASKDNQSNQSGNGGFLGAAGSQTPSSNNSQWLPNHRTQTVRDNQEDIVFINDQDGWKMVPSQGVMMSEPVDVYKTTDGGKSWIKIAVANQKNVSPSESTNLPAGTLPYEGIKNGLSFVNSSRGWITGYVPRVGYQWIFVTNDGGLRWVHQELPVPKDVPKYTSMSFDLVPPTFFNSKDGIIVEKIASVPQGIIHYPNYVFFFSSDGGQTWEETPSAAIDINFPNSDPNRSGQAFSVTVNGITWKTSDSGYIWTK